MTAELLVRSHLAGGCAAAGGGATALTENVLTTLVPNGLLGVPLGAIFSVPPWTPRLLTRTFCTTAVPVPSLIRFTPGAYAIGPAMLSVLPGAATKSRRSSSAATGTVIVGLPLTTLMRAVLPAKASSAIEPVPDSV